MTAVDKSIATFERFVTENPYNGTTEQIVTLSVGLAETASRLDRSTFSLLKEGIDINDKVLSKLKVIGDTLLSIDEKRRRDVVKRLPASYSTIHKLCALKPEELVTGTKSGVITPSLSIRAADTYVKQVRFPRQFLEGEKGRWGTKEETLYNVVRPEETNLGGDALLNFEKELRRVCAEYDVTLRKAGETSQDTLKRQDRAERELFWRSVLEKELTEKWFLDTPDDIRKQFNLRRRDEVMEAPLRSFTGFLMKTSGGREAFWETHGQAYVAKIHLLQEKTDDNAQRYNLKRRLEQVLGERSNLCVWRNILVKENGFFY